MCDNFAMYCEVIRDRELGMCRSQSVTVPTVDAYFFSSISFNIVIYLCINYIHSICIILRYAAYLICLPYLLTFTLNVPSNSKVRYLKVGTSDYLRLPIGLDEIVSAI